MLSCGRCVGSGGVCILSGVGVHVVVVGGVHCCLMHIAFSEHEPVDTDVRKSLVYGFGRCQGRLCTSGEDAGEGGRGNAYHACEVHLTATLLLHDVLDAFSHNAHLIVTDDRGMCVAWSPFLRGKVTKNMQYTELNTKNLRKEMRIYINKNNSRT